MSIITLFVLMHFLVVFSFQIATICVLFSFNNIVQFIFFDVPMYCESSLNLHTTQLCFECIVGIICTIYVYCMCGVRFLLLFLNNVVNKTDKTILYSHHSEILYFPKIHSCALQQIQKKQSNRKLLEHAPSNVINNLFLLWILPQICEIQLSLARGQVNVVCVYYIGIRKQDTRKSIFKFIFRLIFFNRRVRINIFSDNKK